MNPDNNRGKKNAVREKVQSLNRNTLGIIISAAVIVLVLVAWFFFHGGNSNSGKNQHSQDGYVTAENTDKNQSEENNSSEEYAQAGDRNLETIKLDAENGKVWKELKDETYGIQINVLSDGYTGPFVEDGADEKVGNVLALKFTNNGTKAVQYAEYVFDIGKETVSFKVSDLPAGQSCVVLESSQHKYKEKDILSLVTRIVALVDEIPFARDQILVVDNSNDTITVMNLTDKEIPLARVFYKNFDAEQGIFVGGITYNAKVDKIPAGKGVTVSPTHFKSGDSVVVGTGVYESGS